MRIRKLGPREVVLITRIEALILDDLRCSSLRVEHIAARVGVTEDTAENVLRALRKKLKLKDREEIVFWWNQQRVRYVKEKR